MTVRGGAGTGWIAAAERWVLDAGDAAEALLVIPADARRERRFEVSVAFSVRCPDDLHGAWHELQVLADGSQLWRRRISSSNAGSSDSLDYRFSRSVPVGQALRVLARGAVRGVARGRLLIEADEV